VTRRLRVRLPLATALAAVLGAAALATAAPPAAGSPAPRAHPARATPAVTPAHTPRFAYYYIWFDRRSWGRAKTDLPLEGPYDSGDVAVIRQQIRWAKAAGLDGFIVSWKDTPILDQRLSKVIDVAESEHFGLGIIYQGLDFNRQPQPVSRVAADLAYFNSHFAARAPFHAYFPKPLAVWSGTWKYSPDEVHSVTAGLRSKMKILASEKSVAGYERLAGSVDGDAYYWSSVNPDTNTRFVPKLQEMSAAVHAHAGMWIAPVAVGFDARAVGGTSVVGRASGSTLLKTLAGAKTSTPDVLGIISWNEFSENSHLEPSQRYGTCYIGILASTAGLAAPDPSRCPRGRAAGGTTTPSTATAHATAADRADSSSAGSGAPYGPIVLGAFGIFLAAAIVIGARRRTGGTPPPTRVATEP
jgi:hypothetical protein